MRALLHLVVRDVVYREAGGEFARGRVVNDLTCPLADARLVGAQLLKELPAELLLQECDTHVRGTRECRVGNAECIREIRLRQVSPLRRRCSNLVRVVSDSKRTKARRRECAVVIIERVDKLTKDCGLVVLEHPIRLHLVEVGDLTRPDDIGEDMTALLLRSDLSHQLACARRLIVYLNVGIFLLKPLNNTAD